MKRCGRCRKLKPMKAFGKKSASPDGLRTQCKSCDTSAASRWRRQNRKRYNRQCRLNRANNREKIRARDKASYAKNPEAKRARDRERRYGVTAVEYERMLHERGDACAACGQPETRMRNGRLTRLQVDHDHETGKVRSLLCSKCNSSLGYANDSIERLNQLIAYLKRHA